MGRYQEAQERLEESLAIAQEIGDRGRVAAILQPLVWATLGRNDLSTARMYADQALILAREVGTKRDLAAAINLRAQIHRLEGEPDTAEPLYDQVLLLGRELEDSYIIAVGLLNLAMVAIARGSVERTTKILLSVIEIAEEFGSKIAGQSVLEVSAGFATLREDWQRAARFYGAAEAHMDRTGIVPDRADEAFLAPLIVKARNAQPEATFAAAEAGGRALSYDQAMVEVRTWLEGAD